MNKRYQVFISSTYADLVEEWRYVMQALMEMDCIPAGMELFPAADEEQWTFIKRIIDDCDYYLLIIGGRYGSTAADGISYTEKEFDYALEKGIKIICLIHKNPGKIPSEKCENTFEMQKESNDFCEKLKEGRLVKFWEKPEDLQGLVALSLNQTIKRYPAIGFVRVNLVPDESTVSEILKLCNKISELEIELQRTRTTPPEGTSQSEQGEDIFELNYNYKVFSPLDFAEVGSILTDSTYYQTKTRFTWNTIFSHVAPLMLNEANESTMKNQLNSMIMNSEHKKIKERKEYAKKVISDFSIIDTDFQTIKVQLRALDLITKSEKNRSVKDIEIYWTLTPYGDTIMTRLIAIKRQI
jgi:hypothetical protein